MATVRDYSPSDKDAIIDVFRDASRSLKKSEGGSHPDGFIDRQLSAPDGEILSNLLYSNELGVAESDGKIVGIGGITNRLKNRIIGSTYSCNHYVRKAYQGAGIGSMLKKWSIGRAKELGFRKIYGYSTPEAVAFNKKHGAVFFPEFDQKRGGSEVVVHYYEIELKKSFLNGLKLEPYISELSSVSRMLKNKR